MLRLRVIRYGICENRTHGTLFDKDTNEVLCDTIEDRVRDSNADGDLDDPGENKVYGETAIPYGIYKIEVTYSNHFKRLMVLLLDVPHFTGIRMHWGVDETKSLGCILCGELTTDMTLKNIGMTDKLVNLLLENDNEGEIEIFS